MVMRKRWMAYVLERHHDAVSTLEQIFGRIGGVRAPAPDMLDGPAFLHVALAVAQSLRAGELRRGLLRGREDDVDADAKEGVKTALRARAALQVMADGLRSVDLEEALTQADEALAGCGGGLDVLDDDEYLDALGGARIDERAWWGARAALVRALPAKPFERALRRMAPSIRPEPPPPEPGGLALWPPAPVARSQAADPLEFAVLRPGWDLDEVVRVHREGFPLGLSATREALSRALVTDRVFGAFRAGRLIAIVHGRVLPRGKSMGASDIVGYDDDLPADEVFKPITTEESFVVCYAAVTHPDFRRERITQRLITELVLPTLAEDRETRDMPWYTSSPLTHLVPSGRRLARTAALGALVEIADAALAIVRPNGWSSLAEIIRAARPWLSLNWFCTNHLGTQRAAVDPVVFTSSLYEALPTHDDLERLRRADHEGIGAPGRSLSAGVEARVARLYARADERAARTAHAAAFVLLFLAAAFTQAGVHTKNGRPIDPILSFHFCNGARLAREVGPLPNSRREDVAALRFGQVLEYGRDWEAEKEKNVAIFEARRRSGEGVYLDRDFAAWYLPSCIQRTAELARAALGVVRSPAPRLCRGGTVTVNGSPCG